MSQFYFCCNVTFVGEGRYIRAVITSALALEALMVSSWWFQMLSPHIPLDWLVAISFFFFFFATFKHSHFFPKKIYCGFESLPAIHCGCIFLNKKICFCHYLVSHKEYHTNLISIEVDNLLLNIFKNFQFFSIQNFFWSFLFCYYKWETVQYFKLYLPKSSASVFPLLLATQIPAEIAITFCNF